MLRSRYLLSQRLNRPMPAKIHVLQSEFGLNCPAASYIEIPRPLHSAAPGILRLGKSKQEIRLDLLIQ